MKAFKLLLAAAVLFVAGCSEKVDDEVYRITDPDSAMILVYTTAEENTTIQLPLYGATVIVDWGDGSAEQYAGRNSGYRSHTYKTAGDHEVKIEGYLTQIKHSYDSTDIYLTSVRQWGSTRLESMEDAFYNCTKLSSIPGDDYAAFADIQSFNNAFRNCSSLTEIPESLFANCPNVTDFSDCFSDCSSLTSIPENLFANCPNVTRFSCTFDGCSSLKSKTAHLF